MVRLLAPPLPTISTLRADVVPKREMPIRKWFCHSPLWYYHQRGFPGDFECTKDTYERIDPDLRDLCRMLHEAGIRTTPSCQGHFFDRPHLREVWEQLKQEEALIASDGLPVTESSTGKEFVFRALTYEVPWQRFEDFYDDVATQQTTGFLGILLPRDRSNIICRLHNRPLRTSRITMRFDGELSCVLGGSLFTVTVSPENEAHGSQLWQKVHEFLTFVLETVDGPKHEEFVPRDQRAIEPVQAGGSLAGNDSSDASWTSSMRPRPVRFD